MKYQGREPKRTLTVERNLTHEIFAEWERLKEMGEANPKASAIEIVAERNDISDTTLRGIMEKMMKSGETPEHWRRYFKPTSKPASKTENS